MRKKLIIFIREEKKILEKNILNNKSNKNLLEHLLKNIHE